MFSIRYKIEIWDHLLNHIESQFYWISYICEECEYSSLSKCFWESINYSPVFNAPFKWNFSPIEPLCTFIFYILFCYCTEINSMWFVSNYLLRKKSNLLTLHILDWCDRWLGRLIKVKWCCKSAIVHPLVCYCIYILSQPVTKKYISLCFYIMVLILIFFFLSLFNRLYG